MFVFLLCPRPDLKIPGKIPPEIAVCKHVESNDSHRRAPTLTDSRRTETSKAPRANILTYLSSGNKQHQCDIRQEEDGEDDPMSRPKRTVLIFDAYPLGLES